MSFRHLSANEHSEFAIAPSGLVMKWGLGSGGWRPRPNHVTPSGFYVAPTRGRETASSHFFHGHPTSPRLRRPGKALDYTPTLKTTVDDIRNGLQRKCLDLGDSLVI